MSGDEATAAVETRIAAALQPFTHIVAAYLFGSRATGRARPDSDLDVALVFRAGQSPEQRAELILDVIAAFGRELGALGERADVLDLDLDRVSSTIAFHVIRDGRRVLDRDPAARVHLEATIARRYDDDRPRRELMRQAAVAAAERMRRAVDG
jgi:uncharacterized protein